MCGGGENLEWEDVKCPHVQLRRRGCLVWAEACGPLTLEDARALFSLETRVLQTCSSYARLLVVDPAQVVRTPRAVWREAEALLSQHHPWLRAMALVLPGRRLTVKCLRSAWSHLEVLEKLGPRHALFDDVPQALAWLDSFSALTRAA